MPWMNTWCDMKTLLWDAYCVFVFLQVQSAHIDRVFKNSSDISFVHPHTRRLPCIRGGRSFYDAVLPPHLVCLSLGSQLRFTHTQTHAHRHMHAFHPHCCVICWWCHRPPKKEIFICVITPPSGDPVLTDTHTDMPGITKYHWTAERKKEIDRERGWGAVA